MRKFTRTDDRLLAKYRAQGMYFYEVADLLGRTERQVRLRWERIPLPARRVWAPDELEYLQGNYRRLPAAEIAGVLRRPVTQVYQGAARLGLNMPHKHVPPELQAFIREKHALGWSDNEITRAWNAEHPELAFNRRSIQEHRRDRLRLASNAHNERHRLRVAAKTREQLRLAGLPNLAALRVKAFCDFATRHGWPGITRPRLVQILNLLYEQGPHTREQIARKIGVKWEASANHPATRRGLKLGTGRSCMGELIELGLVVKLPGRPIRGRGRGQSFCLYAIAPSVHRTLPALVHQPERKVS